MKNIKPEDLVPDEEQTLVLTEGGYIKRTNPTEFKEFLFSQKLDQSAVVLMSSGNYGGLDFDEVKNLL